VIGDRIDTDHVDDGAIARIGGRAERRPTGFGRCLQVMRAHGNIAVDDARREGAGQLGQPLPESNLSRELNKGSPETTST
jgi:hypothetical protein